MKQKLRKVTKKEFKVFFDEVSRLLGPLGLSPYNVVCEFRELGDNYAEARSDREAMSATFTLCSEVDADPNSPQALRFDPVRLARHEVSHLLLHKLHCMATMRFVTEREVDDEVEALCAVLETVL